MSDEKFQPARSRKNRRRRGAAAVAKPRSFSAQIENISREILDTEWLQECRRKVEASFEKLGWASPEVLCLGLGSPMESKVAAMQLAFIAFICDTFYIAHNTVSFFDPYFSGEDIQGLLDMGFCVLSENKRGKYALKSKTMLFMPHCGIELYENVLRENWTVDDLERILLLGNMLQEYATATSTRKFEQQTPCLSRIWKYLTCDPVSPFDAYPLAFNNLALQYIDVKSLPSCEDPMWSLPAEAISSSEIT